MQIDKIYLDMDGVLADFYKRYFERYRLAPREAEKKKEFNKYFDDFIETRQFASLDLLPGTWDALSYFRNCGIPIEILSSTANKERYETISEQKIEWLKKYNINFKPNFVPGKRFKYEFATPNSIIIDDTESVIDDWNKAGGIGILHKDWNTTLAILSMYL